MRLVVAITGSSAPIYGIRLLEVLRELGVETHLVVTEGARQTIPLETSFTVAQVEALASVVYHERDLTAPISSGSFPTDGMVVAPCSMKTLSAIALSYSDNLAVRAADHTVGKILDLFAIPHRLYRRWSGAASAAAFSLDAAG